MDLTFPAVPAMFGTVHIIILVAAFLFSVRTFFRLRGMTEKDLMRFLFVAGVLMIAAEVWKQWFVHKYVYPDIRSAWFFPWQLCSMAMYLSFFAIYLKGKMQRAALVFLATYSLFADIIAIALPYDMLRPQIVLVVHSFAYHGLVITESMIAMMILAKRPRQEAKFGHATVLFLAMAAIAEVINVVSHAILNDIHVEPNMFYITLAYPTTQPVLHDIAVNYGIPVEIVIYLGLLILMSYVVFILWRKIYAADKRSKTHTR